MSGRGLKGGPTGHIGRLVKVATAYNQPEAEFIEGLLREEGIPSMTRRSAGFDVPDFLAVGPRDVLVPESAELSAREALMEAEVLSDLGSRGPAPAVKPLWLLAGLLVALAVGALVVWAILALAF